MHIIFADTNVFINALQFEESNSRIIVNLIENEKINVVVSELVLKEVEKVLLRVRDQETAGMGVHFIRNYCVVIPRKETMGTMNNWRGQIKEKDLENLAAVKQFHISHLISHDRDYENFHEYRTPKQFVIEMGLKPFDAEY